MVVSVTVMVDGRLLIPGFESLMEKERWVCEKRVRRSRRRESGETSLRGREAIDGELRERERDGLTERERELL